MTYQENFDALQMGTAILTEEDGIIQSCNAAFRALTLQPEADPVGSRLVDVVHDRSGVIQKTAADAAAKRHPVRSDRVACMMGNGSIRYYNIQARPISHHGRPAIMLNLWDVTTVERTHQYIRRVPAKNSQLEGLFRNRLLLQTLMDHVPEGIAVTDIASNRITWASRYGCELLGVTLQELLQIPLDELSNQLYLYHLDGQTRAAGEEMPLLRAAYDVIRDEEWILHQPGRQAIHVMINAGPILDSDGTIVGSIIVWHDITRQHEAEQQAREYAERLERSNHELQDFAFIVSHDLQEPLRKVRMFGNMLKEHFGEQLAEEGHDYITRMQSAALRMQQMIDNLLVYSRVTTRPSAFEPVDLSQVIVEVLVDLEGRLRETGGVVEVGDLPEIQADAMQMQQLFQNLIGNALKYHRPGIPPVVSITAAMSGRREVEITVRDNGIGFDMGHAEEVFKPFHRLHGRSEYEGTGMGLAICRRIVERHKGRITARSVRGEGSTFLVRLPITHPKTKIAS